PELIKSDPGKPSPKLTESPAPKAKSPANEATLNSKVWRFESSTAHKEGPRPRCRPTVRWLGVAEMRAVRLHEDGLRVERLTVPAPAADEALVRVHAAAITRDELTWPSDRLPAIPSYELSGAVAEIGSGVSDLAVGDEVFALTPFDRDGVAADYAAVPASVLAPRP